MPESTSTYDLHIGDDLPVFEGHFPGAPLVPGALQLEWMLQKLDNERTTNAMWTIKSAKFLKPLLPNTNAVISATKESEKLFRVSISSKAGIHASATFIQGSL